MSGQEDRTTVTLGPEEYQLQPQPYPRLFRQLSEFGDELQQLGEMDATDAAGVVAALGERAHAFLKIFIPNLMSENQFAGRGEDGRFDPVAEDRAPTLPQLIDAVEAAFEVNGGKRLGGLLGKLLGPALGQQVQRLVAASLSERLAQGSMSSPSPNAGRTPASSTAPSPTPAGVGTPPAPSSIPGRGSVGSPSLVS